MSGDIDQTPRLLRIKTPLDGDKPLALRRLMVREAISRPFHIVAEAIALAADIAPEELLNKTVTFTIDRDDRPPREFHALVRAFGPAGKVSGNRTLYRIEAAPRLWTLSLRSDCRVFQDTAVKDIVQTVVEEGGAAPVRFTDQVPASPPRPYCVQYNETDLDFVQRLLDELGCGYFFEHTAGNHTLVVAHSAAEYPNVPGDPVTVRLDNANADALTSWTPSSALHPAKVKSLDYDLLRPSSPLQAESESALSGPSDARWELFAWPGGGHVRPEGSTAELGMEAVEAGVDTVTANGADPAVFAGGKLRVAPLIGGQAKPWLITAVVHTAYDETHLTEGGSQGYSSALTLIPGDRQFRPPNARARPVVPGLQSAIVTGPGAEDGSSPSEEIHVDSHGRVKVRFLWDRAGKRNDGSSLWVRVAQPFAGKWGGAWFLPRVGDEVLVGFVDGDPDKPVVVGSLYNAEAPTPWALDANKTQTGFRTRSSKQGTAENANILRFEDKKGSEEFFIQAEKDKTVLVKNNRTETIHMDDTLTVEEGDKTVTVAKGDFSTTVSEGDCSLTVSQGDRSVTVEQGDHVVQVDQGDRTLLVGQGDSVVQVDQGDAALTVKQGDHFVSIDLGKSVTEAMQSIELKVGSNSIKIEQSGITISGLQVKIEGKAQLQTTAPMSKHEGSGMMTITGGLVKIN